MNAPITDNSFSLWNAHKAYMRGILVQMGARLKRTYVFHLNKLLKEIRTLESNN